MIIDNLFHYLIFKPKNKKLINWGRIKETTTSTPVPPYTATSTPVSPYTTNLYSCTSLKLLPLLLYLFILLPLLLYLLILLPLVNTPVTPYTTICMYTTTYTPESLYILQTRLLYLLILLHIYYYLHY